MSTLEALAIKWDNKGLVPAVVQDHQSHAVLMLAYMNEEALTATLETGIVHFFSRSRQSLWKKGESSGNTLTLVDIRTDCDSDAIVVLARPAGPTCHTGTRSCFYKEVDPARAEIAKEDQGPVGARSAIADKLFGVLCERRDDSDPAKSYTRALLDKGFPRIEAKIAEESGELLEVLADGDESKVVHESADLLFHMLVGLCARGIEIDDLWGELDRRFGVGGHQERASRSKV
ncbi:MAG: bifunctional phosphoribosyl-AMP cyclohydrolase/phosphoribosyl-ATP diphosphatase HisIE [Myxococcales bacterium]|nr:bifunctional phosphoribosyl-AMP cyclohydrolase/phosphoribosyl-ATP diphosphatase HisIE [Myxococcales bacterium]